MFSCTFLFWSLPEIWHKANIQAYSSACTCFTFGRFGGSDIAKDQTAVHNSCLFEKIESLLCEYTCIPDWAYEPTENLVPVFG
jgi:hypothetical protein